MTAVELSNTSTPIDFLARWLHRVLMSFVCIGSMPALVNGAFIVEAHESGLGFDQFEFGGDTSTASTSIPSTAIGLRGIHSIFGGDGIEFGDTYEFKFWPGVTEDNFFPAAGSVLGSKDGSPGNGNTASGLIGGISGLYNVYATSPASVNVNGVPSIVTLEQDGDDIQIDLDQNNEMTGEDSQISAAGPFVGGMNNAWHLLGTVDLVAGEIYSVIMEAGNNTFVSQRIHAIMWERVSGGSLPGDFNGDDLLDAHDIDQLTAMVIAQSSDPTYDLNNDGDIDLADRVFWIESLATTWFGDSNLDGEFNSSDFVLVFSAGEYEDETRGNSTWGTGDWNGDGDFNSTDFVIAFSDGGFEVGPRPAAIPVPEGHGFLSFVIFACVIAGRNCCRFPPRS